MKLGFIRIGNMASAIINGIDDKENICVSGRDKNKTENRAKSLGVRSCESNLACAQTSDILFLCVKPEKLDVVLTEISPALQNKTLVSIAAKRTIQSIENVVGNVPIIRVMPNLNVAIKKGISALCYNDVVSQDVIDIISDILNNLGGHVEIPEEQFSGFIGIAGSSPAFVFKFIEALAQSVKNENIPYDLALKISAQAVSGSAQYLLESGLGADELVQQVCSPGGTTIEGVKALNQHAFASIINKAVQATIEKDKKG